MTADTGKPDRNFETATAEGEWVWALDLAPMHPGGPEMPVSAHRIVTARQEQFRGEVRVAACGRDFTAGTHPKGWWTTRKGELPLQPHAVHCGAPHEC